MSFLGDLYEKYQNWSALSNYRPFVDATLRQIEHYKTVEYYQLLQYHKQIKNKIWENPKLTTHYLPEVYAIFSEMVRLSFGFELNKTQLFAAVLMWDGKVAELKTGEGKTVTAALPAYLQSMTGKGMHVITTNDYLAKRDKEWMNIVFRRFGIDCGLITQGTERAKRKKEYLKPITYISNQEVAFDYLRDNLVTDKKDKILNDFHFAIIDEVDSILIDEARTPFIISEPMPVAKPDILKNALEIAKQMSLNDDFEMNFRRRTINLTDAGISKIIKLTGRDIFASGEINFIRQIWYALYSLYFLKKDKDYILRGDKLILVDEFTGHQMPDRRLLDGLEQMVELSAGVPIREENKITASITYGTFFKMYEKVAGMSGTVMAAKDEFFDLYGLEAFEIAPPKKNKRIDLPTLFFRTKQEKENYFIEEVRKNPTGGSPILIVGRSVGQANYLSYLLEKNNIKHQILTAEVTDKEFEIIENAGKKSVITVATNMAGRGADIILEKETKEKNGLAIWGMESNLSKRVDDQLRGRSGRQGSPGTARFLVSLEDELFQVYGDDKLWNYAEGIDWPETGVLNKKLNKFLTEAQNLAESTNAEVREISMNFEDIISRQQKFIYAFRDRILETQNIPNEIFEESKNILAYELPHQKSRPELLSLRPDIINLLKKLENKKISLTNKIHEEIRKEILSLIDNGWQEYLEQVYWLEDWIFLKGVASEDPLISFIKESEIMFHDMRSQFSSESLKLIGKFL